MSYSVIGILAILIHFIVNEDVLLRVDYHTKCNTKERRKK